MVTLTPSQNLSPLKINMKTARFLLVAIGISSLTLGLGYAAEPPKQAGYKREQTDRASLKRGQAGPMVNQITRTPPNKPHQPGLKPSNISANGGLVKNKSGNLRESLTKFPPGDEAITTRPSVVRGRIATTAAIGGLGLSSSAKYSAGPLNGAAIHRKP